MENRRPVVLRTDTTPARLQELPAGDLLDAATLINALQVALTGLASTTGAPVTAADTLLVALGKLVAQNNTYTTVPTTNMGPVILVTAPHHRHMVWNGTAYERAPWHRPGVIFYSDGPAANIKHGIQLRSDVTYNTADHPDLAAFYGFAGSTFVLKDARARVIRSADLGRGIDTALVNGYLQEDAIRNISGTFGSVTGTSIIEMATGVFYGGTNQKYANLGSIEDPNSGVIYPRYVNLDASRQVPTASENRVKSLVATAYVTR